MKYIRNSYKKNSRVYNLMFFIISIGFTLGLIVSLYLKEDFTSSLYEYFYNHINNYNASTLTNILYPIITYFGLFIISLTILGIFVPFLMLFLENMSIGLIIGIILKIAGLKGLLFGLIYFIFTKLPYLLILIYLILNLYKFVTNLINSLKIKNNNSIYNLYSRIIIKVLFCIFAILIYNLLGIIIIPKIIKLFIFLL